MQIRAVAGDNTFVQGVVLRWYNDSFRLAYGNYPKGVTTIAWISGKTEGIDPKLLRFYGMLESFEFCFTDNAFANLESFARALPRGSFSKLRVLSYSYVELGNLRYRQQSVQSV